MNGCCGGYLTRFLAGCILSLQPISFARGQLPTATNPSYTAAGIVNAATQLPGVLAPNTITTLYGSNLSWSTQAVTPGNLDDGTLPTSLDGVSVIVNGILSSMFFVSPGQINFLIPYEIIGSSATVVVERQGIVGPAVTFPLATASPGFLQWNGNFALAQHADGSLITASAPAQGGEVIVLYAVGLGRTIPDVLPGEVVTTATSILYKAELEVLLNGSPCPPSSIWYAGLTPGFAGLYQINLQLPQNLPPNPEIQMSMGAEVSPAQILLYAE